MNKIFKSFAIASVTLAFLGCTSSPIDVVKDSKLRAGSTITIGKAFDASFGNPSWTETETAKGRKIVEFQGDVDEVFLEMVASTILDEGVTSLMTLGNCVDGDFAAEMIGNTINAGLSALLSLGKVDAGKAIAEPVAKRLQEKDLRLSVIFEFADESNYRISYFGFKSEDWNDCELQKIVDLDKFLDFTGSDHEYKLTKQLPKKEKKETIKKMINETANAIDSAVVAVDSAIVAADSVLKNAVEKLGN